MNIPLIRIEIDRLRESVSSALISRGDEINGLILEKLNKALTEEWVVESIGNEVDLAVKTAISRLSENYALKSVIEDVIVNQVSEMLKGRK